MHQILQCKHSLPSLHPEALQAIVRACESSSRLASFVVDIFSGPTVRAQSDVHDTVNGERQAPSTILHKDGRYSRGETRHATRVIVLIGCCAGKEATLEDASLIRKFVVARRASPPSRTMQERQMAAMPAETTRADSTNSQIKIETDKLK